MTTIWQRSQILPGLCAVLTASSCFGQAPITQNTPAQVVYTVNTNDPGWIWDHMLACDASSPSSVSPMAGRMDSSATYVFTGTGVTIFTVPSRTINVSNVERTTGKLRISIDGIVQGEFTEYALVQSASAPIFSIHNLQNKNHSIVIRVVDGWGAISSLSIERTVPTVENTRANYSWALPNGTYKLSPACAPGSALDANAYGKSDGSSVDIWGFQGGTNQLWTFTNVGGGWFKIQPAYSTTLCLEVYGQSVTNGSKVDLWEDNGGANTRWRVTPVAGGYVLSPGNAPDQCLNVDNNGSGNGTRVQIWSWSPGVLGSIWTITNG